MSDKEPTINVGTIGHVDHDKSTLTEVVVICGGNAPPGAVQRIIEAYNIKPIPVPDQAFPAIDKDLQDWQKPGKRRMGRPR